MAKRAYITGWVVSLLVVALLVQTLTPGSALAQRGPVKIGVLLPLTGGLSPNGQEALDGTRLYFDEIGWQVAGRKIELTVEDTEGKPDVGLTKAKKLVERDQVHLLAGIVSSGVVLAVSGYVREKKIPLILNADAGASLLTKPGRLLNPYVFRFSQTADQFVFPGVDWAYKDAGWRKVATITSDFAGGLEVMGAFARGFCLLGGRVIQEFYPPLGTSDFAPFLAGVDRTADAVVVFAAGADGLRIGRQLHEYGLIGKMPILDLGGQIALEHNLPQLRETALGVYSAIQYTPLLTSEENRRFVSRFKAKYNRPLNGDNGPDGYAGARAIAEALTAIAGNAEDRESFMAALRKVDFDSPKGRIRLDQFQNVIQSIYIRRVERVGGEYGNVPIKEYKNVSQFWTWTPEEYARYPFYTELKGKFTDCNKVLGK